MGIKPSTVASVRAQALAPHKYGAKAVEIDGIRFASMAEGRRYQELRLMERAGRIRDLELQPKFPLEIDGQKVGFYRADFAYYQEGVLVVEDVKVEATKTPVYRLKKKLVKAIYGIEIQEVEV